MIQIGSFLPSPFDQTRGKKDAQPQGVAEVGHGVALAPRFSLMWRAVRPLPVIGATAVLPRVVRELQTTIKVERSDTGGPGSLSVKWAASGVTRVTPVPSTWQPDDLVVRWAVKCPMSRKGAAQLLTFSHSRFDHIVPLVVLALINESHYNHGFLAGMPC